MNLIVLLDAGLLGMITNAKSSPENEACKNCSKSLPEGVEVVIPEIADYEVGLGPAGRVEGLAQV